MRHGNKPCPNVHLVIHPNFWKNLATEYSGKEVLIELNQRHRLYLEIEPTNDNASMKESKSGNQEDNNVVAPEELIDDDDDEFDFIESSWENGVETGLTISWPTSPRAKPLHLSTKLQEDCIAPLFDGTQWAGTRVWKAAVVALEYLLEKYPLRESSEPDAPRSPNRSLLELGCGLGVPAMLWHLLQESPSSSPSSSSLPDRVVLSDMPDLLPQLKGNVGSNFADYYGKSIEARALSWSADEIDKLLDSELQLSVDRDGEGASSKQPIFDICLNCDCVYEPLYGRDAWEALADALAQVARRSPSTILVTSVERRNGDGLENFLDRLGATGTVQLPIECVLRNDDDKHHVIEIYVTKGVTS